MIDERGPSRRRDLEIWGAFYAAGQCTRIMTPNSAARVIHCDDTPFRFVGSTQRSVRQDLSPNFVSRRQGLALREPAHSELQVIFHIEHYSLIMVSRHDRLIVCLYRRLTQSAIPPTLHLDTHLELTAIQYSEVKSVELKSVGTPVRPVGPPWLIVWLLMAVCQKLSKGCGR